MIMHNKIQPEIVILRLSCLILFCLISSLCLFLRSSACSNSFIVRCSCCFLIDIPPLFHSTCLIAYYAITPDI